ncbi:MAG TPA: hypothetical protein VIE17_07660 [Methylophilaceae bacterium]|jgi:hypothetical protein
MEQQLNFVVAVFDDHRVVETAVGNLLDRGFEKEDICVVGKGYHSDEGVAGFYNNGRQMRFWGKYGPLWDDLWKSFIGGIFLTVPSMGPVVVLGSLARTVVSAAEGVFEVSGLSVIGTALFCAGIPREKAVRYESAVKADGFLIKARGNSEKMLRARIILSRTDPILLDSFQGVQLPPPIEYAPLNHLSPRSFDFMREMHY